MYFQSIKTNEDDILKKNFEESFESRPTTTINNGMPRLLHIAYVHITGKALQRKDDDNGIKNDRIQSKFVHAFAAIVSQCNTT